MIKYPNGQVYKKEETKKRRKSSTELSISSANRGMSFENDINISNEYYREKDICLITKRPTPINVVKVDYSKGAKITHAYFEEQSTTDYNGVYKSRYIDFEAKNTKSNSAFPLSNISEHQIVHLKNVLYHGGIAFFIISFQMKDEIYLLDASFVIDFYEHGTRKSIPYEVFKKEGILIRQDYSPRLHYIEAVDALYFK